MRAILGAFFCLVFTVLIYEVEKNFVTKQIFKIDEISFRGNSDLTRQELTKLGHSIYGKNIFQLDFKSIKEHIEKDVRIESVDIIRDDIGKVKFQIKEKDPKFYVNIGNKMYSTDSEGNIFSFMDEQNIQPLPIIYVKNEKELIQVIEVLSKVEDENFYQMISEIYYKNPLETELLIGEGSIVKTNSEVASSKYKVAKELYKDLVKNQKIEYLDLRFDGYIVKSVGVETNGKR